MPVNMEDFELEVGYMQFSEYADKIIAAMRSCDERTVEIFRAGVRAGLRSAQMMATAVMLDDVDLDRTALKIFISDAESVIVE